MPKKVMAAAPCPAKSSLRQRPLMSYQQALEVESLFEVLSNDTRLRLLHALVRVDEACTTALAEVLEMKLQAVSNQLQRLQDKGIVASRRDGNNVFYHVVDGCVVILLERGLCLVEESAKRASG